MAAAVEEAEAGGLTALDWVVIVAATVAVAAGLVWLYQHRGKPTPPPDESK